MFAARIDDGDEDFIDDDWQAESRGDGHVVTYPLRADRWFGKHPVLRYLPKKIANFLHEYHDGWFPSLNLPRLPSDRSQLNVHAMLSPLDIARLLRRLQVVSSSNT